MRSHGGPDTISNLVALRTGCHVAVHAHPAVAYDLGLLIRNGATYTDVPVTLQSGRMMMLDEHGGTSCLGWNPLARSLPG
jgi:hypothetical protein